METINGLLDNLYKHTNSEIEKRDFNGIDSNLELFGEVLGVILTKSVNPLKSNLFKIWGQFTDKLLVKMVKDEMTIDTLRFLKKYYKINKEHGFKVQLNFDNTLDNLLIYVREEKNAKKLNELDVLDLFIDMLENTGFYTDNFQNNNIPYQFSRYYICVYQNSYLDPKFKKDLIEKLINQLLVLPMYKFVSSDLNKANTVQQTIEELLKTTLEIKDTDNFLFFLKELSQSIYINENFKSLIFVKISIYLFYIISKEDLISNEDKELYSRLLKDNRNLFNYHLNIININNLWISYKDIQDSLHPWERFGTNAKVLIMRNVVMEFFFFLSIANGYFRFDELEEESLNEELVFIFLNSYIQGNQIANNFIETYKQFKELFGFLEGDILEELKTLSNQLKARYKKFNFDKVRNYAKNFEIIEKNKYVITKNAKRVLADNPYLKTIKSVEILGINQKDLINFLRINTPINFIANNIEKDFTYVVNVLNSNINNFVRHSLLKKSFLKHKIMKYNDVGKVKLLKQMIKLVEELGNKNIDSLIYGIKENSSFLYAEEEGDKVYYHNLLNQTNNKEYIEKPEWIGFNKEDISINHGELKVVIRKPSDEEINQILQNCRVDDVFLINITNEINIEFEREEAIEYLKLSKRIIEIFYYIEIETKDDSTGFLLEIN